MAMRAALQTTSHSFKVSERHLGVSPLVGAVGIAILLRGKTRHGGIAHGFTVCSAVVRVGYIMALPCAAQEYHRTFVSQHGL